MAVRCPWTCSRERVAGVTLAGALLLFFGYLFYITVWLCDDSYITLRTVWNWTNGYGLRWNVGERV